MKNDKKGDIKWDKIVGYIIIFLVLISILFWIFGGKDILMNLASYIRGSRRF